MIGLEPVRVQAALIPIDHPPRKRLPTGRRPPSRTPRPSRPSGTASYQSFAFCGVAVWTYFSTTLAAVTSSLVGNASLITKVYFPRLTIPLGFGRYQGEARETLKFPFDELALGSFHALAEVLLPVLELRGWHILFAQSDRGTITGTVTDDTPSGKDQGTPAISDASMDSWMAYLYQQQPFPTDATGVPITLDTIDPNGNLISRSSVSGTCVPI